MHLEVEKIGELGGGCSHYKRHCLLEAPCCGKSYSCRLCHDKDPSSSCDDLNRHTVQRITCSTCGLKQLIGEACLRCGQRFGLYFCGICRMYDDNIRKEQYHCVGCGSCRLGGRHKYKHCDRCGACYSKKNFQSHGCVEAALDRNCPVCLENLKASTSELYAPRCGHILHKTCHSNLLKRTMQCPICSRSYLSFSNNIEKQIEEYPLPPTFKQYRVKVMCQACKRESDTQFHPLGHKCAHCSSYNTTQIGEPVSTDNSRSSSHSVQAPQHTNAMSALMHAQERARQSKEDAQRANEAAEYAAREVEKAQAKLKELEMIQNSLSVSDDEDTMLPTSQQQNDASTSTEPTGDESMRKQLRRDDSISDTNNDNNKDSNADQEDSDNPKEE